jgi:DNA-binding IclR family transcriptional regulator
MKTSQKLTPTSETAKKTLGLLDVLSKGKREWTAAEVAKEANLPHSTAFRLLSTLVELRFVEYDSESRRYQLGLKLLELGHLVSQRMDLPSRAMPFLKELAQASGETAHLSIRDADCGVFIAKVDGEQSVRMHTPLGRRVTLHAGASMKSLLVQLSDEELDDYIEQRKATAFPVPDRNKLHTQVRFIREHGYCSTIAEQTPGAAGVSAPVRNHAGEVVAALTISGPESRFSKENILRFAALVTHAAAELSKQLGNV